MLSQLHPHFLSSIRHRPVNSYQRNKAELTKNLTTMYLLG